MQRCTVYFIWKLLYVFRVVPPHIIRSANNCIYSIWYLSHRYCYLPLSWKSWNWFECAVGGVGVVAMYVYKAFFMYTYVCVRVAVTFTVLCIVYLHIPVAVTYKIFLIVYMYIRIRVFVRYKALYIAYLCIRVSMTCKSFCIVYVCICIREFVTYKAHCIAY